MSSTIRNTMQTVRRRRRPPRSCEHCRRRKVKCNRKEPCAHCIASKISCVYKNQVLQREKTSDITESGVAPPTPEAATTPSRHLEAGHAPTLTSPQPTDVSSEISKAADQSSSSAKSKQHQITDLEGRLQALEHVLSLSAPVSVVERHPLSAPLSAGGTGLQSSPIPNKTKATLNKSRLFGPSHWTNDVDEFKRISEFLRIEHNDLQDSERVRELKLKIHVLLQKCKFLARGIKASRPSRCIASSEPPPFPGGKNFADKIACLYITRYESVFRILHIPSFWTEYEHYWRSPADVHDDLKYKTQLVVAIGCSLYRETPDSEQVYSRACQWVYAAQAWLSAPMEKDRLSISGLQIQCLLIIARQSLSVSGDLIWIAMGTLVRTAMQLGLHRDPKHFTKMSPFQAEIRRRLWATIMELNVQAALDSGMPSSILFDDFDTELPSNINDAEINDGTKEIVQNKQTTDTSLQRFLFNSLRPRLEILRIMNGVSSEMTQAEVICLTSEISNACRNCQIQARIDHDPGEQVFHHNLADLFLRRFLLSLHRPWANRCRPSPLYYFSRKVAYDSATALLSPQQSDEFTYLILRGSGIFKNRMIHVSLALASELLIEVEEQEGGRRGTSSFVKQHPWNYKNMLVAAVKEAQRQSAQRMRFGETNVKLHMKLSIALNQVEDLLPGQSRQEQMIQSAKDSLEMAYKIIQANLGLSTGSSVQDEENINNVAEEGNPMNFSSPLLDIDDILQNTDMFSLF